MIIFRSVFVYRDVQLNSTKVKLQDAVYPIQSMQPISGWSWFVISLAILFWIFRLFKVITHAIQYWDIKKFYNTALKIMDVSLFMLVLQFIPKIKQYSVLV